MLLLTLLVLRNFLNMQDVLDKYNVNWLAIWEPMYDTTTPQGRMIINTMMNLAQFEAENTGSRINQVFDYKVKQGEVISGTVPFGYRIENKHLIPDDNAPIVKDLFEYYDRTNCIADLTRYAIEKHGIDKHPSTWRRFLKITKYAGFYRGNDEYCTPIISRELFNNVQRKLAMNIKGSEKNERRTYIFTGLLKCYSCGLTMTGVPINCKSRNGTPHTYYGYRCHRRYDPNGHCNGTRIRFESTLEKNLINTLSEQLEKYIFDIEASEKPKEDIAKKKAAITRKISRLKELYVNDLITLEEYKSDREVYETELSCLDAGGLEPEHRDLTMYRELLQKDIKAFYYSLDRKQRQFFWRSILKEIHWSKDGVITPVFL